MLSTDLDLRLLAALTTASAPVSPSRRRQLHWVAGELTRFWADPTAGRTDDPAPGQGRQPLATLLGPAALADYLHLAETGALRSRLTRYDTPTAPRPGAVASARTRRDCLTLLCTAAGLPAPPGDRPLPPALHPHLDPQHGHRAITALNAAALGPRAQPLDVRAALVALLAHQHGLRTGEIAALLLTDFDQATATLTWRDSRPAAGPGELQTATLHGEHATVLQRWLTVRATLAQPRTRQLLVSVQGNHDGAGVRRPAGLGLQHRGLARAHARAIATLNARQLGQPGFVPLPATLGLLRPVPAS